MTHITDEASFKQIILNNMDEPYQCIYKIFCADNRTDKCYIGSSLDLKKRMSLHKSVCNNMNNYGWSYKLYKKIRKYGGIENWMVEVLESTNLNYKSLRKLEQDYINRIKPELNKNNSYVTKAEMARYMKIYYLQHWDKINSKRKIKNTCGCGGKYTNGHITDHKKGKKHIRWVETNLRSKII